MAATETHYPVTDTTPSTASRIFDRIFGYDFFISYSHADAPGYAAQLHDQLNARRFNAFLDKRVYVAGDDLNAATLRRVRASSKLIIVVGPHALESRWVAQEVEVASRAKRPIIAIDLLGELSKRADTSPLAARLKDVLHISEPTGVAAAAPSDDTLLALTRSFQAIRRESLRWRLAWAAIIFFAGLAAFSYWQKRLADDRADQYLAFCNRVVEMVTAGNKKINDLRISEFGGLIADVTATLAKLPDPKTDPDLRCVPVGAGESGG